MQKPIFLEIHLPRDAAFLTVEQVPRLIVTALNPADPRDEEEQQTIYLQRAIRNGALKTFGQSMNPSDPLQATAPLARILVGDLIRYLESSVPTVRLKFQRAMESNDEIGRVTRHAAASVNPRHVWQEEQIIRSIKALDFKPLALPADDQQTNFYVKSIVRARCGKIHGVRMRASVFDQAWERLLGRQALSYSSQK